MVLEEVFLVCGCRLTDFPCDPLASADAVQVSLGISVSGRQLQAFQALGIPLWLFICTFPCAEGAEGFTIADTAFRLLAMKKI